jgi:branched-chain amino acid transport system permease protein
VSEVLQFIASGLATGAIYGLVGVGFVLIYNVTGVINFAQGEYLMLGAMSAATLVAAGVPVPVAFVAATVVAAGAGALIERATIAPARRASIETLIIITIGVSIIIRGIALLVWGVDPRRYEPFTAGAPVDIFGLFVSRQSLWVFGFALLVASLLWFFLGRTTVGKAMRACAMNPQAARLQGISPSRMSLYAFALSTAIAGAAGVVLVPITSASYDMGLFLGINGFTAAVIGGLVSPLGAIVGGLLLGAVEFLAAGLISSGLKDAIALAILFIVLVFRREGLLSARRTKRV